MSRPEGNYYGSADAPRGNNVSTEIKRLGDLVGAREGAVGMTTVPIYGNQSLTGRVLGNVNFSYASSQQSGVFEAPVSSQSTYTLAFPDGTSLAGTESSGLATALIATTGDKKYGTFLGTSSYEWDGYNDNTSLSTNYGIKIRRKGGVIQFKVRQLKA